MESSEFYYAAGSAQRGPFTLEQLRLQGVQPDTLVWRAGMPQWLPAASVPELAGLFQGAVQGSPLPPVAPFRPAVLQDVSGTKIAAGICGILLGWLGIHKFLLGYIGTGVLMLLISVVGTLCFGIGPVVMSVFGLIEGIIYLTKSDEVFRQTYVIGKKNWF